MDENETIKAYRVTFTKKEHTIHERNNGETKSRIEPENTFSEIMYKPDKSVVDYDEYWYHGDGSLFSYLTRTIPILLATQNSWIFSGGW